MFDMIGVAKKYDSHPDVESKICGMFGERTILAAEKKELDALEKELSELGPESFEDWLELHTEGIEQQLKDCKKQYRVNGEDVKLPLVLGEGRNNDLSIAWGHLIQLKEHLAKGNIKGVAQSAYYFGHAFASYELRKQFDADITKRRNQLSPLARRTKQGTDSRVAKDLELVAEFERRRKVSPDLRKTDLIRGMVQDGLAGTRKLMAICPKVERAPKS